MTINTNIQNYEGLQQGTQAQNDLTALGEGNDYIYFKLVNN